MKQTKIGIVIVTYNSEKFVALCLDSLLNNDYLNKYIIVIDNASHDKTVSIITKQFPRVYLIKNRRNIGFAAGANQGIRYLLNQSCEYILLLNPDTSVNVTLLSELRRPFLKNSNVGITGCIIIYQSSPNTIWFGGGFVHPILGYTQHKWMDESLKQTKISSSESDFITGCCMLVKRQVFETIGLLDEKFAYYFEDVDLCCRAKNAGFVSYLVNKPLVKHTVSASTGIQGSNALNPFKAYYYGRNPLLFIKKQSRLVQKMSFLLGYFLVSSPYYLFRTKNIDSRLAYLRGMRDGILS